MHEVQIGDGAKVCMRDVDQGGCEGMCKRHRLWKMHEGVGDVRVNEGA